MEIYLFLSRMYKIKIHHREYIYINIKNFILTSFPPFVTKRINKTNGKHHYPNASHVTSSCPISFNHSKNIVARGCTPLSIPSHRRIPDTGENLTLLPRSISRLSSLFSSSFQPADSTAALFPDNTYIFAVTCPCRRDALCAFARRHPLIR